MFPSWSYYFPDYEERMQVIGDACLAHLEMWEQQPDLAPSLVPLA